MMKRRLTGLISLMIASTMILSGCSLADKVPGYSLIPKEDKYDAMLTDSVSNPEIVNVNTLMTGDEAINYAENLGTYTESELKMLKLEYKLDNSGLSEEEYSILATLYEELGFIKCERDILEQDYRLYGNEEVLNKLNEISVNLAEEEKSIVSEANLLLFDLTLSDRLPEVVHTVEGEEWFKDMMPKLKEGKRTYFRENSGVIDFSVEVGYNEYGEYESTIRFLPQGTMGDTTGVMVSRTGDVIKVYEEENNSVTSISEIGSDQGEKKFILWTIDTYAGTIKTEEGTMKDGNYIGAYKVTISQAVGASLVKSSAFDLFNNKETLPSELYSGEFAEDGTTTLEEPSESNIKALAESVDAETAIVYAYNEDKTKCLYKGVTKEEKEQGVCFGSNDLSLPKCPKIQDYEVKDKSNYSIEGIVKIAMGTNSEGDMTSEMASNSDDNPASNSTTYIAEENLKVRIYDGEIQIYNGTSWISMGDAKEIAALDPFENAINSDESGNVSPGSVTVSDSSAANADANNSETDNGSERVQVASNKPATGVGSLKQDSTANSGNTANGSTTTGNTSSSGKTGTTSSGNKTGTSSTTNGNQASASNQSSSSQAQSQPASNPAPGTPAVSNPDPSPSTPATTPSAQEPSTPAQEPSTPAQEPSTPAQEPSTPSQEPNTPEPPPSGGDGGGSSDSGNQGDGGGNKDADISFDFSIDVD